MRWGSLSGLLSLSQKQSAPAGDVPLTEYTIGGVQSGTLALGDYTVESDIVVKEGATLTLTADSIFRMENRVLWEIQGKLTAIGTADDRITFQKTEAATLWHGIRFCKEKDTDSSAMTADAGADTISVSFGLNDDWPIKFSTTGTLPAPLEPDQRYYIVNSNQLALRMGGSAIDITDTGTGTHTAYRLNPTSSDIKSTDYAETQTLQYCDFSDADTRSLPSNYSLSYRHWERGGAIMTWETETMVFDHLRFYRCGAEDRGGACYIQGPTSTLVLIEFDDWYFEDCAVDQEVAAGFAASHGQAGVTLSNFDFSGSVAPATVGTSFTADATANTITVSNPGGFTLVAGLAIKDLQTSGTLPGGLAADTVYYMKNVSGSTFEVALTPGGASIDITDTGTGSHTCVPLEDFYCFDTTLSVSGFTFS